MAIYKCKMCGGTLEFEQGATVGVCDHCGTKQTLPRLDDERRTNLYDRANHFRRNNDYDKAAGIYEKILNEDATDAEAYWSLVLCRYGIEYVEDPATHRRVPTVNRAQFTSVFDDGNYKSALQYAGALQRALYEEEAAAINEIQKGILAISQKEEPFDVFICYKETDANGRRTQDSVLANDLYHQLTQEGFKVFFSRITLEDKLGTAYEPYIFAALNSAKVMVVLGTKPEHFNAVWVKNEWSRYLALVKQSGGKKVLIPAYRDMDPYDLPEEFSHLQAQDMSKLGFMQDLIRGIKKIAPVDAPKAVKEPVVISSGNTSTAQPLIDRGYMALEDKEWAKADDYFEQALNLDAKNGDAYLGKFLVSVKCDSFQRFLQERGDRAYIDRMVPKPKTNAFQPNNEALQKIVQKYVVPGYLEEDTLSPELSGFDLEFESEYDQIKRHITNCFLRFEKSKDFLRAKQYGDPEISKQVDDLFKNLKTMLEQAKQTDAETIAKKKKDYQSFVQEFQIKASQMSEKAKEQAEKDRISKEQAIEEKYQNAVALANKANSVDTYNQAIKAFVEIRTYRDSDQQVQTLTERRNRFKAQIEKEQSKKKKKIVLIAVPSILAVIILTVLTVNVFIPWAKYNTAVKLYEKGAFSEAISAFEAMDGYKDSSEMIKKCKDGATDKAYVEANALLADKKYEEAKSAFKALKGYKDSKELIKDCEEGIKADKYTDAQELYESGKYEEALSAFRALGDFKDSVNLKKLCETRILDIKYSKALKLYENGKLEDARAIFRDLDGYKDSTKRIATILSKGKVGSTIKFGVYEQDGNAQNGKEEIEWLVLAKKSNSVLVISKYGLHWAQYEKSQKEATWDSCSLRTWLNDSFIRFAFNTAESKMIQNTTITSNDNQIFDGSSGYKTEDKVFLLSADEAKQYFKSDTERECEATNYAVSIGAETSNRYSSNNTYTCGWWLRSTGGSFVFAPCVTIAGSIYSCGNVYHYECVRPAMWINLST